MSVFCGCCFFALLGAVLHTVLLCLLSVFGAASWLSLLVGLLRPVVAAVSTSGIGGVVAMGMMYSVGGKLTAVRAQLSYLRKTPFIYYARSGNGLPSH